MTASRTESQPAKGLGQGAEDTLASQTTVSTDPFVGRVLSHYRLEARLVHKKRTGGNPLFRPVSPKP